MERTIPSSFGIDEIRFRMCFSAPSFQIFVVLVIGLVLTVGKHTRSQAILTIRPHESRHFATIYRFLGKGQWNADMVSYCLFVILVETLIAEGIEILVVIDDTLNEHSGPRICGAGWQHEGSPPKHTRQKGYGPELCGGPAFPVVLAPATGGRIAPRNPKRCEWSVPRDRIQA